MTDTQNTSSPLGDREQTGVCATHGSRPVRWIEGAYRCDECGATCSEIHVPSPSEALPEIMQMRIANARSATAGHNPTLVEQTIVYLADENAKLRERVRAADQRSSVLARDASQWKAMHDIEERKKMDALDVVAQLTTDKQRLESQLSAAQEDRNKKFRRDLIDFFEYLAGRYPLVFCAVPGAAVLVDDYRLTLSAPQETP